MNMIIHKAIPIQAISAYGFIITYSVNESFPVIVVFKYILFIYTSQHYMVYSTAALLPCLPRHLLPP